MGNDSGGTEIPNGQGDLPKGIVDEVDKSGDEGFATKLGLGDLAQKIEELAKEQQAKTGTPPSFPDLIANMSPKDFAEIWKRGFTEDMKEVIETKLKPLALQQLKADGLPDRDLRLYVPDELAFILRAAENFVIEHERQLAANAPTQPELQAADVPQLPSQYSDLQAADVPQLPSSRIPFLDPEEWLNKITDTMSIVRPPLNAHGSPLNLPTKEPSQDLGK